MTDEDTDPGVLHPADPAWLAVARKYLGVHEVVGELNNPLIVHWLEAVGPFHADEVPWCSAFANACMREAGLHGTGSAAARSWLRWGDPLDEPRLGCVVVFSRPPLPASGHVAFCVGDGDDRMLRVLGGNQLNAVSIAEYPIDRLLGFRWPTVG